MRRLKQFFAMLMTLAICLGLSVTAFAADGEYTITINKAASGEKYTAYKIFDALIAYDSEGKVVTDSEGNAAVTYTIGSDSAWYEIVAEATDVFTLRETAAAGTYYVTVKENVPDDDITRVFITAGVPEGAEAAASENAPLAYNDDGSTGTTTVALDVSDSGPGYYFVTTSLGATVSIDTTTPTATIVEKNTVPNVYKYEHDHNHDENEKDHGEWIDNDEATIGDTIDYEVFIDDIGDIISGLCLHDHMSDGLTFSGAESVAVFIAHNTAGVESDQYDSLDYIEIERTDTVTDENGDEVPIWTERDTACTDGCTFEVAFADAWTAEQGEDVVIKIIYTAVMNEHYHVDEGEENDVFISYAIMGLSRIVYLDVYTYGFDLEKTNGTDQIDGAVFELYDYYGEVITLVYDEESDTYIVYDEADDPDHLEETTTEIAVGRASIIGLEEGEYTLKEITAPRGYNRITEDIIITITAVRDSYGDVTADYTVSVKIGDDESEESGHLVTIENKQGRRLPRTGGMGTTPFTAMGLLLVFIAGGLMIAYKRRKA